MQTGNSRFAELVMVVIWAASSTLFAAGPSRIDIRAERMRIKVSDPLAVQVTCFWPEPVISSRTNEVLPAVHHGMLVQINDAKTDRLVARDRIWALDLRLEGAEGTQYGGRFVIFHDPDMRLVFEKAGTYAIQVSGWKKKSNVLTVEVEPPGELEKRAMLLLSDPYDYLGLTAGSESDINKDPERLSRLQRVADECEGTVVGNLAAAAVGIRKFEELEEKYVIGETFVAEYRAGKIEVPLLEQAYAYFSKALRLPDEFPVREELLWQMAGLEMIKRNYDTAGAYAAELGAKYTHGRYGSKADNAKRELRKLQAEELEQSVPEAASPEQDRGMLGLVGGIGVGILIIAVAIVVVMKQRADRPRKSPETK